MKLMVNGEEREFDAEADLSAVVTALGAEPQRVATMLNGRVVTRAERQGCLVAEGDVVEVLVFAGGG